jgi:DNA-directed RNA polymerase subunit RPC12/RpoP
MIENNELADDPLTYVRRRRCPHCTSLSHLTHSLLDSQNGNTIHVYQCIACGKRIWDEGPRLGASIH